MLFYILLPLLLALALLVLTAIVTAVIAVVLTLLPVNKVPFSYNLRNLQVRWKTTFVTGMAFTLVVGLLIIMLAFVRGMDRITQSSAVPGNVIVLADGATDEVFSDVDNPAVEGFPVSIQAAIQTAKRKTGQTEKREYLISREVYALISHVVEGDAGRKRRFIQMRGVYDPAVSALVHNITLAGGGWFSASGVRTVASPSGSAAQTTALEVVVGDGIAKTLGGDLGKETLGTGDLVQIGPNFCYVTGLMNPSGSFGSEVWALDGQIQQIFNRGNKYSSFVVRTADDNVATRVAKDLRTLGIEKYNAITEKEYYARLEENNQMFRVAVYFLGCVMAIGGVLGVMNTMFAAISQRSKDIGVLRLLGYTRFQVLCSFLVESLLIALLGGLLGCVVGSMADGWTASSIVSSGQGGGKSVVLRLVVDGGTLLTGLFFALVMGAVGGLIPSISAMRLRPLESLR